MRSELWQAEQNTNPEHAPMAQSAGALSLGLTILKYVAMALLIILVVATLAWIWGMWSFSRMVDQEVAALYADAPVGGETIVTEAMLTDLPEPAQRYLRYSGVVGKPLVNVVRLTQEGRFKTAPDRPWMDFTAEEYYRVDKPAFIWDATFTQYGLPILRVRDSYQDGHGSILGKVGGLIPVVQGAGEGIDQGSMLRLLQEMVWFPSAFLHDNITFAQVDENAVEITFTDQGKSVSGVLYLEEDGRPKTFVAERFRGDDVGYGTWNTPFIGFADFGGRTLPNKGVGIWEMDDGDYTYIELVIPEIEVGTPEAY